MTSGFLIENLARGANPVAEAFDARTNQLEQKRNQEEQKVIEQQRQKDAEMLKVFEFAGNGFTDEARFLAQSKGLQVPEEIFKNGAFAKGLSIAGNIYDQEPDKAQAFTMAYMAAPGDISAKYAAGLAAGGKPVNKDDRELAMFERKLQIQNRYKTTNTKPDYSNFKEVDGKLYDLSAPGGPVLVGGGGGGNQGPSDKDRRTLWARAYNEALGAQITPDPAAAVEAANIAVQAFDAQFAVQPPGQATPQANINPVQMQGQTAGSGLTQPPVQPQANQQDRTYALQQLLMGGMREDVMMDALVRRGMNPAQAKALILEAKGAVQNGR